MRTTILLDALSLHSGGARTHLRELLRRPPDARIVPIVTHAQWAHLQPYAPSMEPVIAPELTTRPELRHIWRQVRLSEITRSVGASVYYDPSSSSPTLPIPCVAMVRNMLPFDPRNDEWYGRMTYQGLRLARLRRRILTSVSRTAGTIFVSEWSKSEVLRRLPGHRGTSCVITHGIHAPMSTPRSWPEAPRWLYVSDVEPYKRQIETALAYDAARAQGGAFSGLTLTGRFTNPSYERALRRTISNLRFRKEITLTGWLDGAGLRQECERADGLLFTSSVECCPNILLESLAAGKPIVCSAESPMPEFAKDAVVYVDSANPLSIAEGLRRVGRMPDSKRNALCARARSEASRYSWDATARRTWAFLEEVSAGARSTAGAR